MRVLITAGPTREYLDPVRYLSNASSGRMGISLAAAAKARGDHVTLVLGPTEMEPPEVDELVRVTSAADMFEAVVARFDGCDLFMAAAAVCDYRPVQRQDQKIKKARGRLTIALDPTADVIGQMSHRRHRGQVLVGFCLETMDLERRARDKLEVKALDLVVANGPEAIGAERQDALIVGRGGRCDRLTQLTKAELADRILEAVAGLKRSGA
jgi:phosphopantothenoylcysteine decarboxylase/phosphopantothenate--cysteine ligase